MNYIDSPPRPPKQELPSNTNVDDWVALEINFREDLIIFPHVFNPKLKHNLYHGKVISTTSSIWIISNVKLVYTLY